MSKYELISRLRELGFEAEIIDRIPYILNVEYEVAERAITALGYNRSWGWKKEYKREVPDNVGNGNV